MTDKPMTRSEAIKKFEKKGWGTEATKAMVDAIQRGIVPDPEPSSFFDTPLDAGDRVFLKSFTGGPDIETIVVYCPDTSKLFLVDSESGCRIGRSAERGSLTPRLAEDRSVVTRIVRRIGAKN